MEIQSIKASMAFHIHNGVASPLATRLDTQSCASASVLSLTALNELHVNICDTVTHTQTQTQPSDMTEETSLTKGNIMY
jgi:hypothetical protein